MVMLDVNIRRNYVKSSITLYKTNYFCLNLFLKEKAKKMNLMISTVFALCYCSIGIA